MTDTEDTEDDVFGVEPDTDDPSFNYDPDDNGGADDHPQIAHIPPRGLGTWGTVL